MSETLTKLDNLCKTVTASAQIALHWYTRRRAASDREQKDVFLLYLTGNRRLGRMPHSTQDHSTNRHHNRRCSGVVVEYRTRNREVAGSTHTRSTASNLEQVVNLLCAQAKGQLSLLPSVGREISSSYGYGGEGLVWLIGAMVCLLAAPWVQLSVSAGSRWTHNALRYHIDSCQSAATSEIAKRCWSRVWLM